MSDSENLYLYIFAVYLIAGVIKGLLGLGLPTTAITLMSFFLSPLHALAMNLMPMFSANIWQFWRADHKANLVQKYAPFAISLMITIFYVSFFTASLPVSILQLIISLAVIIFALFNLFQRPIILSEDKDIMWQMMLGASAGILGALTSMWAVPLVIYLLARNLTPKAFVDASGFLLLVGCLPLTIGYVSTGIVTKDVILPSLMGAAAALSGFAIGEYLRNFVNAPLFRRLLLWFFLVMGIRMAALAIMG